MTTLNDFKQLRASVPADVQTELVSLAAEKDITLTVDEVKGFLNQMDEEEEFDDIELDAVALAAIAGGDRGRNGICCQEEAHDEPWGRCPGMRPMRKWYFGRQPVAQAKNLD